MDFFFGLFSRNIHFARKRRHAIHFIVINSGVFDWRHLCVCSREKGCVRCIVLS